MMIEVVVMMMMMMMWMASFILLLGKYIILFVCSLVQWWRSVVKLTVEFWKDRKDRKNRKTAITTTTKPNTITIYKKINTNTVVSQNIKVYSALWDDLMHRMTAAVAVAAVAICCHLPIVLSVLCLVQYVYSMHKIERGKVSKGTRN